jgi:hypothetical protein
MTIPVNLPDFGTTLSCTFDLDAMGAQVTGLQALSQALIRRITTPRGRLLYDPNYGYDIMSEINDDVVDSQVGAIGAQMDQEFLKDQRVFSSTTTVTLSAFGEIDTTSLIQSALGPFSLVLNVTAVSVNVVLSP